MKLKKDNDIHEPDLMTYFFKTDIFVLFVVIDSKHHPRLTYTLIWAFMKHLLASAAGHVAG